MMGGRPLLLVAAISLAACARPIDGAPAYRTDQCARVTLVDAATGKAIAGAEDLAIDAQNQRILISAYDRRAVEAGARKRDFALPSGGVYALPFADIESGAATFAVASIVSPQQVAGGLRPHGMSFDPDRREIVFINRSYQKIDGAWRMTPRIERIGADGAVIISDGGAPRCSANDVAIDGEETIVSFDHASCGWRGALETLTAARRSGVETEDGAPIFDRALFANGVVALEGGDLALAATRERAVLILRRAAGSERHALDRRIPVPGGPDNLTVSEDGSIVAALHPSLVAIGLQRRWGLGRSASRVVEIDPAGERAAVLFDDPEGAVISAASVAVKTPRALVIGSAVDQGLAVCRPDATAP